MPLAWLLLGWRRAVSAVSDLDLARRQAAAHGLSPAVADELHEQGWVAHERGIWNDLATRAGERDRLRASLAQLTAQLERESRAGGQYAEIRRQHAATLRSLAEGGDQP